MEGDSHRKVGCASWRQTRLGPVLGIIGARLTRPAKMRAICLMIFTGPHPNRRISQLISFNTPSRFYRICLVSCLHLRQRLHAMSTRLAFRHTRLKLPIRCTPPPPSACWLAVFVVAGRWGMMRRIWTPKHLVEKKKQLHHGDSCMQTFVHCLLRRLACPKSPAFCLDLTPTPPPSLPARGATICTPAVLLVLTSPGHGPASIAACRWRRANPRKKDNADDSNHGRVQTTFFADELPGLRAM